MGLMKKNIGGREDWLPSNPVSNKVDRDRKLLGVVNDISQSSPQKTKSCQKTHLNKLGQESKLCVEWRWSLGCPLRRWGLRKGVMLWFDLLKDPSCFLASPSGHKSNIQQSGSTPRVYIKVFGMSLGANSPMVLSYIAWRNIEKRVA